MNDVVSHALYGRGRDPEGLSRALGISGIAHVSLVALLIFAPAAWFGAPTNVPRDVMTISLGGAPGPRTGGMTPISGRPVQQAVAEPPRVAQVRPPAAKTPEMTDPTPTKARPVKTPVEQAPKEATSRTPTQGAETRQGRAMAETGSEANSIGLSTAGGGFGGQINLGNFCCPEYIGDMIRRVHQNWNSRQGTVAVAIMRFTIHRDGTISEIQLAQSSGNQMLDFLANRAMLATRQLGPLPDAYPNQTLTVNLSFEYQR